MRIHRSLLVATLTLTLTLLLVAAWRWRSNESAVSTPESLTTLAASARTAEALSTEGDPAPVASPGSAAMNMASLAASDVSAAAALGSQTYGSSQNTVNALLTRLDHQDLALYGNIERRLHRDVPREVHGLVALKRSGAPRQQLLAAIREANIDLGLRLLLARWVEASYGVTAAASPPLHGRVKGSGPAMIQAFARRK